MIHVREFLSYACNQLGEDPDDALIQELLFDWVNEVKDEIVNWTRWRFLEAWGQVTVPASGVVYFPDYVDEVLSMWPSTLGYRRPTHQLGSRTFDDAGPTASSGLSNYDIPWGYYGVHADHDADAVITATSSAGAADNGMQIVIDGLSDTAVGDILYDQSETLTLAGLGTDTGALNFAAGVEGVRDVYILNSTRAGLTQGLITITSASGQVLVRLDSSRELRKTFLRSETYPASGAGTMNMRFYRHIPDVYSEDAVIRIPRQLKAAFTAGMNWKIRDLQGNLGESIAYYARLVDRCKAYMLREQKRPGMRKGLRPNQSFRNRAWRLS